MTEGERPPGENLGQHELKDAGNEIDLTEELLNSSPMEFAEKLAGYSDSDKLVLNLKLAEAHPDFIRRFLSGGGKRLVRVHCSLDDFDKYSNSDLFPKSKDLEWVCD